ncbi:hypothetical protein OG218_03510 [Kineococcus sp. NBC_00420]|uniref:hypothetical protein n=1 Tax=Kineococcus sp. NBC_00420 TaxID=2903564 RepID=UPI002E2131D8
MNMKNDDDGHDESTSGDRDGDRTGDSGGARRADGTVTDRLAQATMLLRQHTDAGWEAIEDRVLARALSLFRPSAPLRGRHHDGDFFVASDVLVAQLREAVDAVPHAAAQQITCTSGHDDQLESVTIQLIALFGTPLLELADRIHLVALKVLRELLGELAPAAEQVHTHVHIGDVSRDARIVD